jgi:hypothetical protein
LLVAVAAQKTSRPIACRQDRYRGRSGAHARIDNEIARLRQVFEQPSSTLDCLLKIAPSLFRQSHIECVEALSEDVLGTLRKDDDRPPTADDAIHFGGISRRSENAIEDPLEVQPTFFNDPCHPHEKVLADE